MPQSFGQRNHREAQWSRGSRRIGDPTSLEIVSDLLSAELVVMFPSDCCPTAEGRIVTWRDDATLKVPVGSLFRRGNDWAVFVLENRRARLRLVRIATGRRVAPGDIKPHREGVLVTVGKGRRHWRSLRRVDMGRDISPLLPSRRSCGGISHGHSCNSSERLLRHT